MTEEELQILLGANIAVWEAYMPYLAAQMQLQIIQGSYAGLTAEQILENINTAVLSESQIETLITTALNDYSRLVTLGMMQDAPKDEKYIYIGPLDGKTRDLCVEQMSAGSLTYDQIIKNFGSSVLKEGGGYNCRHKWESQSEFGLDKKFYNPKKAKEIRDGSKG
tara:strand:- start:116 stop:610 length:495 start_codon:yes stop_codon:yes gene_type:complete